MDELKCKHCGDPVDPKTGLVVYVGYGEDNVDWAPSAAFCNEEHLVEWLQCRIAERNGA